MKTKLSLQAITAVSLLSITVIAAPALAQNSATRRPTQSAGAEKTLTGVISDTMCGATHMAKNKTAAECTRMCVQQGQKYALVVANKVYTLTGHEPELDKLAGQRVTVRSTVTG